MIKTNDEGTGLMYFKFIITDKIFINNYVEKNSHACG